MKHWIGKKLFFGNYNESYEKLVLSKYRFVTARVSIFYIGMSLFFALTATTNKAAIVFVLQETFWLRVSPRPTQLDYFFALVYSFSYIVAGFIWMDGWLVRHMPLRPDPSVWLLLFHPVHLTFILIAWLLFGNIRCCCCGGRKTTTVILPNKTTCLSDEAIQCLKRWVLDLVSVITYQLFTVAWWYDPLVVYMPFAIQTAICLLGTVVVICLQRKKASSFLHLIRLFQIIFYVVDGQYYTTGSKGA
jgi:hypothetical protein